MDISQERVEKTIKALRKNGFVVDYFADKEEALQYLLAQMEPGKTVGTGGSITLEEINLLAAAQEKGLQVIDRKPAGATPAQKKEATMHAIFSDYFFCSANAITEEGEIYNVDGMGNRLAALVYGPKNTYIVAGINKIVPDFPAAVKRVEEVAAPKNVLRLKRDNPCSKTGHCMDCRVDGRICCAYLLLKRPMMGRTMHVVLIGEELGY